MRAEEWNGYHRYQIGCHVMSSEWSVTFTDTDKRRIGPWLLCNSQDEVVKILTWGNITAPELDEHYRNIARWGVGGGTLHLTSRQRFQLIARGPGWPWNGYELRKMKIAGSYPPQPLTPLQEAAYLRNKANHARQR